LPIAAVTAAVGAAATIGGSAISASASKKASKAAQQAAADNNALARETRDQISGYVSPYMPGAYAANSELSRLLGGSSGGNALGVATGPQPQADWSGYLQANPDVMAWAQAGGGDPNKPIEQQSLAERAAYQFQNTGQAEGRQIVYAPQAGSPAQAQPEGGYYGPAVADRPEYTRPDFGSAPATPNIDPENYKASPYFDWLLNQGNRNMKAGSAAGGLGQSGAAVKEAINYGQGLAGQDYQKWVGNLLALDGVARNQWNQDRQVANQNYDVDTQRDIAIYDDKRNYDTSRFDTRVGNLFQMSNQGLGAAGMLAGNANNYAGNVSNNNNSAASATGNAAISSANSVNNMLGQGLQGLGYLYGAGRSGTPAASGANPFGSSFDYRNYNLGGGS